MNSTKIKVDISYVAHLADCLEGRVEVEKVSATIVQLRGLVDDYKRKVCLQQTVGIETIPENWFPVNENKE